MTHPSKKTLTFILLIAVFLAGGYYAYNQGLIPRIGQGNKAAFQLKTKVEAASGVAASQNILATVSGGILKQLFASDLTADFSYDNLITGSDGNIGIVEIEAPVLKISAAGSGKVFKITVPLLKITQNGANSGEYSFSTEGEIAVFTDNSGKETKMLSVISEQNKLRFSFKEGKLQAQKTWIKNLKISEGRSGAKLFEVAEINSEANNANLATDVKTSYKGVVLGDMLKLFIGNIDPINIDASYKYSADAVKINSFSAKITDYGLDADGDLKMGKNKKFTGKLYVKLLNYNKAFAVFGKYLGLNPADDASLQKFVMESGADEGADASFDLQFDENEKIRINGKTETNFKALLNKHFPKNNEVTTNDRQKL